MKIIYAQERIEPNSGKLIFLAGPTPRGANALSWRPQAIKLFAKLGFNGTLLVPEMRNGFPAEFEYSAQIDWEQDGLELANKIMFWVPREIEYMPAFTTNIEFGYWLAKDPSKIIMGYPNDAPKMNYFTYKCDEAGIVVHNNLKETIKTILKD